MAKRTAKKKTRKPATKEQKCRKNIAMLLSLMGFKDENPAATVKILLARLTKIHQEKSNNFKKPPLAAVSTFKKPEHQHSTIKKVSFKFDGKTTTISLKPPQSSVTTALVVDQNTTKIQDSRKSSTNIVCSENRSISCSTNTMINNDNVLQENDPILDPGQDLRNFIASVVGGSRFKLLIQKKLTTSDVTKSQGRLLIPTTNVEDSGILTEIEKRELEEGEDISLPVLVSERREWTTVNLKRWNMNKKIYALKTGWNGIVDTNGFKEGVVIQVWSFRDNQERLCLAIVRV
uniref:putative B3 domain-containing protein At2g27410 n=1 Tax=Erigeron canadensis TaxID=72917 RepID=UPI001CB93449|nr:putative B3 domain-containing protein At2g27410 [Erigeron canadensis]